MSTTGLAEPPESNHVISLELGEILDGPEGCRLCPGVNCCARCGSNRQSSLQPCSKCDRVLYCRATCRDADREIHKRVCPLLQLIEKMGDVEYTGGSAMTSEGSKSAHAAMMAAALERLEQRGLPENWATLFGDEADPVGQRLLSARMSYPLSLGWCLANVPGLRMLRRALAPKVDPPSKPAGSVASAATAAWVDVLILGASAAECCVEPAELWALAAPRRALGAPEGAGLRLTFVGPEVPEHLSGKEVTLPPTSSPSSGAGSRAPPLSLRYFRGSFDAFCAAGSATQAKKHATSQSSSHKDEAEPKKATWLAFDAQVLQVDAIVCFNPGFTCLDYNWSVGELGHSCEDTPFVVVTNTVTESLLDRECLSADHCVGLAKVTQTRNPFSWLAWRQSGTLANDVYRKNSAVLAGRVRNISNNGGASKGEEPESYADLARSVAKRGGKKRKKR